MEVHPDPDKASTIINIMPPTNTSEVRCFLVMINQLAKFSPQFAELSASLREVLRKDRTLTWSTVQDEAFCSIKIIICALPLLALYDSHKPTLL